MLTASHVNKAGFLLGRVECMTLGQLVYVVINSAPNGLDTSGLLAKLWERKPEALAGEITEKAEELLRSGLIRFDDGQWYAPGPNPVIWKSL